MQQLKHYFLIILVGFVYGIGESCTNTQQSGNQGRQATETVSNQDRSKDYKDHMTGLFKQHESAHLLVESVDRRALGEQIDFSLKIEDTTSGSFKWLANTARQLKITRDKRSYVCLDYKHVPGKNR